MQPTTGRKWRALFRQRCPRCCEGPIYTNGEMNQRCPVCQLLLEREPGYFLGAMYISYGLATGLLLIGLAIGNWLFPDVDLVWIVIVCAVLFLPFVPMVTRYSRVMWIFFDRWAWPSRPGEND